MSVRVTWLPSTDADIASYDLEKAVSIGGPWSLVLNITHTIPGPNWDAANTQFFYLDNAGTESTYYRLTAIDSLNQRSPSSTPFRVSSGTTGIASLVNTVSIPVGDVSSLLDLGFTHIEVWATEDSTNWYELTAGVAAPAVLYTKAASNTFRLGGLYMDFQINGGAERHVDFQEAISDWTPQQVVDVINAVSPGTASVELGMVKLSSQTAGRSSSITILNYPTEFGLEQGTFYGRDARLELVDGASVYQYYDVAGTSAARYKWRFSANGQNPVSKYSQPKSAATGQISNVPLSLATARFVGFDGRPAVTSVILAADIDMATVGAITRVGQPTTVVTSDETGFWFAHLVKGSRLKVAIEGTNLVRTIIVPQTDTFDLLQALSDAADPFTVQVPAPLLTRRNV